MVLMVDGCVLQATDPESLMCGSSFLQQRAADFNPSGSSHQLIEKTARCLYVAQKEMVAVRVGEQLELVGSEDATTCHIVLLVHRDTNTAALAHLDSCDESDFEDFEQEVRRVSGRESSEHIQLDTYIVGGYQDERGLSAELSESLLQYLAKATPSTTFHLQLCYIGSVNTVVKDGVAWPRVYGAAYSLTTDQFSPARFAYHGPDTDIRSLRSYSDLRGLLSLYNGSSGRLVMPPFTYPPLRNAHLWLQATDEFLLNKCSTSPLVEPPDFCEQLRKTFRRMLTDPKPLESIFKGRRAREYERDPASGEWRLINPEQFGSSLPPAAATATAIDIQLTVREFIAAMKKSY